MSARAAAVDSVTCTKQGRVKPFAKRLEQARNIGLGAHRVSQHQRKRPVLVIGNISDVFAEEVAQRWLQSRIGEAM